MKSGQTHPEARAPEIQRIKRRTRTRKPRGRKPPERKRRKRRAPVSLQFRASRAETALEDRAIQNQRFPKQERRQSKSNNNGARLSLILKKGVARPLRTL